MIEFTWLGWPFGPHYDTVIFIGHPFQNNLAQAFSKNHGNHVEGREVNVLHSIGTVNEAVSKKYSQTIKL